MQEEVQGYPRSYQSESWLFRGTSILPSQTRHPLLEKNKCITALVAATQNPALHRSKLFLVLSPSTYEQEKAWTRALDEILGDNLFKTVPYVKHISIPESVIYCNFLMDA